MTEKQHDTKKGRRKMRVGKKLFSIFEIYVISFKAFRGFKYLRQGRKTNIFDEKFQERIMLAVTSVNSCALCSYAHAEMALKAGISNEEIKSFVEGEFPEIPAGEVKAVLFAQHYADVRGRIDRESWEEIIKEYGLERAKCILAATRSMMWGNAVGIPIGSIGNRLKGKKGDGRSTVLYEVIFTITLFPILLLSFLQALLFDLFRVPFIKFRA